MGSEQHVESGHLAGYSTDAPCSLQAASNEAAHLSRSKEVQKNRPYFIFITMKSRLHVS